MSLSYKYRAKISLEPHQPAPVSLINLPDSKAEVKDGLTRRANTFRPIRHSHIASVPIFAITSGSVPSRTEACMMSCACLSILSMNSE